MAQPSYTIYNLYNATLTYQSQPIASGSTYTPPTTTTQVAFASDISLLGDVGLGYVGINFGSGSGTITGPTAVTALKNLVSLIPVNTLVTSYTADGSGNLINSYNSQLSTNDIINTSISSGSITVSTTAVAARVGSSNLSNRKMLLITPINGTVYLGSSSSVTTATGIPIFPNNIASFALSANVTPYLIAAASTTVNVFEGA